MITCNKCRQLKRPDEMTKGKGHCKLCRNDAQNSKRREHIAKVTAKQTHPLVAEPRTPVSNKPLEPERTYYRNDGLKHILSRGMPT